MLLCTEVVRKNTWSLKGWFAKHLPLSDHCRRMYWLKFKHIWGTLKCFLWCLSWCFAKFCLGCKHLYYWTAHLFFTCFTRSLSKIVFAPEHLYSGKLRNHNWLDLNVTLFMCVGGFSIQILSVQTPLMYGGLERLRTWSSISANRWWVCGELRCFKDGCCRKEATHSKRLVSPIQYQTKCEIWSQSLLLFLS